MSVDSLTSRLGGIEITTPIDAFFATFPSFDYDPHRSAAAEFQRLRRHQQWREPSEYEDARRRFHTAFEAEFNSTFGGSIADWRRLCDVVGITPVPESLTKAKKVCYYVMCVFRGW
jgi:hypothetical protein